MRDTPKYKIYFFKHKYFFLLSGEIDDDYFDSLCCYTLDYYIEQIKKTGKQIELEEAKREYGSDFFYCKEFKLVGLKSESECGSLCPKYDPRNKRSGRCRFNQNTFEGTGKKYVLTETGLVRTRFGDEM